MRRFLGFLYHSIREWNDISFFNSLKIYLIEVLMPKGKIYQISIKKIPHPLFVRARTSDGWLVRSILIRDGGEYPVFDDYRPKFIIDAGANIGIATVFFKRNYPDATIVAIEPDEQNCESFRKNTATYQNVYLVQAGLGSEGNRFLKIKNSNDAAFSYQLEQSESGIPEVTIEEILKKYAGNKIDILKIDIEGGEKELFEKNTSWIAKTDNVLIELHDHLVLGSSKSVLCAVKSDFFLRNKGENVIFTRDLLAIKTVK